LFIAFENIKDPKALLFYSFLKQIYLENLNNFNEDGEPSINDYLCTQIAKIERIVVLFNKYINI
jgi:hypothetical protein